MIFSERVLMTMDKAPDGWPQKLYLHDFDKLDEERKKYYKPLYATYRTKKVRDYDIESGQFCGWKPIQIGIGTPVGYKYVGYLAARIIDTCLKSNVIMERVLNAPSCKRN